MAHLAHVIWRASRHKGLWPWLAGLAVAALVIGCGGGGTSTAGNGVGVGGTGAAATGPVSGYGSIIVNGVRFDFSGATFTSEDAADTGLPDEDAAPTAALERPVEFGTVVNITSGSIHNDGVDDLATASKIVLLSAIRGPIESKGVGTLTVLGQPVDVDAGTWYTPGYEFNTLNAPNKVVVYGELNTLTGHYKATRVEYALNQSMVFYKVRGVVSNLNLGSKTFDLNGIRINYNGALGANLALHNGDLVRVRMLANSQVGSTYQARLVAPALSSVSDGTPTRLSGVAASVDNTGKILVLDGTQVDFSKVALTDQPTADGRVEIEGTFLNGVLVATKVTVKPQTDVELSKVRLIGPVDALSGNTPSGNFKLKGDVVVNWDTHTQFDPGVTNETLRLGLLVDVEGNRSSTSQTAITATRIRLASH